MAFNYLFGSLLLRRSGDPRVKRAILVIGVSANLAALVYYKYLFPVLGFLHEHGATGLPDSSVVLPLGISFFTFTQIGYLIDASQGGVSEKGWVNYSLFVTFFPHLIAGPIVHHRQMMPQFAKAETYKFHPSNFAVGLTMFAFGLVKKTAIADTVAGPADILFNSHHINEMTAATVWFGVLSYSMQLYFDFSGYSDMAIGLARMFGIRFPANFNSPYKSTNIIEFWQRWHMTLTRYVNAYLYNPIALAIARRRRARGMDMSRNAQRTPRVFLLTIATPTMITMILIGSWHGAGVQYLCFGLLHGVYLTINHAWRLFRGSSGSSKASNLPSIIRAPHLVFLTYLAVLAGQVLFRASSMADALEVFRGLFRFSGPSELHQVIAGAAHAPTVAVATTGTLFHDMSRPWIVREFVADRDLLLLLASFLIAFLAPNTQEILANYEPVMAQSFKRAPAILLWRPNLQWSIAVGLILIFGLSCISQSQRFLYFQF